MRGALVRQAKRLKRLLTPQEWEALRFGCRGRVADVELPHVRDLPPTLRPVRRRRGARRSRGLDGVELRFAHAYTMASPLSRLTRAPMPMAHAEQCVRLPLEVLAEARRAVSETSPSASAFSPKNASAAAALPRMQSFSAARSPRPAPISFAFARRQVRRRQASPASATQFTVYRPERLRVHAGIYFRRARAVRRNACRRPPFAARARRRHQAPVVYAGGIHSLKWRKTIWRRVCDIVGAAGITRDPDSFHKIRLGFGDQVRVCGYADYCEGLDQKHKQVTCQLWDEDSLRRRRRARDGKRRLTTPASQPPDQAQSRHQYEFALSHRGGRKRSARVGKGDFRHARTWPLEERRRFARVCRGIPVFVFA